MINDQQNKVAGTGMLSKEELILGDVPWTKAEVRAVTVAKLDLLPHHHVLDIGAGTGTVTLEIARRVFAGQVVAVEDKEKAIQLIRANIEKFQLANVQVIQGHAPECLPDVSWDRIFIGGTGGKTKEILQYACNHLREGGIIVINTVTINSLAELFNFIQTTGLTYEIIMMQISRIKDIAGYSLYQGENPIHVITLKKDSNYSTMIKEKEVVE